MISIIDYEAGNLTSVKRALDYLGIESIITPDPVKIRKAEKIIFPGVGHAASAMKTLRERGLDQVLKESFKRGTPILGICLGTQIILSRSEEGDTGCLDLIEGLCPKFNLNNKSLKIPHMGWDSIEIVKNHPVLCHIDAKDEFYFVHSFYPQPSDAALVLAWCEYETKFAAVIGKDNLIAAQFHPEKSGPAGLEILRNFCKWNGESC